MRVFLQIVGWCIAAWGGLHTVYSLMEGTFSEHGIWVTAMATGFILVAVASANRTGKRRPTNRTDMNDKPLEQAVNNGIRRLLPEPTREEIGQAIDHAIASLSSLRAFELRDDPASRYQLKRVMRFLSRVNPLTIEERVALRVENGADPDKAREALTALEEDE